MKHRKLHQVVRAISAEDSIVRLFLNGNVVSADAEVASKRHLGRWDILGPADSFFTAARHGQA